MLPKARFASHEIFPGETEMSGLMRAFAWEQTPLGAANSWPQSLKTVTRILLTSRYAMWMGWGPDLTFLYNERYGQMSLGIKHPWALGKSASEVWREIWRDIGPRIQKVLETGEATWDEGLLLFLERSGYSEETYHTFSYSPLPGDDGRVMGMLCVVTEETERVIGERRLKSLRTLAAELGTAITESDFCGRIEHCLHQNQRDLPFSLTYLIDEGGIARLACSTGFEAAHSAAPPLIGPGIDQAAWPVSDLFNRNKMLTVEDLAKRFGTMPSGAWDKPVERAVMVPLQKQGQEVPAGFFVAGLNPYRPFDAEYSGFMELIGGQIAAGLGNARAWDEERRRAELLAELDRAKTAFFTNVSHEFRTPLTLMLGPLEQSIERLQKGTEPEKEEAEQLKIVHRNGLRLLKLVNALLDFSRVEAGRTQVRLEPVDLASFTAELASMFRSATEKAELELIVDCPPLEEQVYIDPEVWEKITLNLLSNAFKFTLNGSIRVHLRREHDTVRLDVTDTGVGIAPEHLGRVFERFHRVDGPAGRTIEGTGIGLALVQELVRLLRGSISVQSTPDEGSTFTVVIPVTGSGTLTPEKTSRSHPRISSRAGDYVQEALQWLPSHTNSDLQGELLTDSGSLDSRPTDTPTFRVMVVDDNADMRDYLGRLLA